MSSGFIQVSTSKGRRLINIDHIVDVAEDLTDPNRTLITTRIDTPGSYIVAQESFKEVCELINIARSIE